MAKMRITAVTNYLGSFAEKRMVRPFTDRRLIDRLPEGRPASPGIEFCIGVEQVGVATNALERPVCLGEVVMSKRPLSCGAPGHAERGL